ncbi:hypothetical protein LIA77_01845 [Sarocladium implicatum]|nr:hypothetical protein LIA77_01845 [Sarocladium implicatum]
MCDDSLFGEDDLGENENGEHHGYGEHHADDEQPEIGEVFEFDEQEEYKEEDSSSDEDETPYGIRPTTPVEAVTECPFQSCGYRMGPKDAENAMTIHVETEHSMLKCLWCNRQFYKDGSKDELQEHVMRQHKDMILKTLGAGDEKASARGASVFGNGPAGEDDLRYSSSEEIVENRMKPNMAATTVATDTVKAQESSVSSKHQLGISTTPEATQANRKGPEESLDRQPATGKQIVSDRGVGENDTVQPEDTETAGQDFVPGANMFCSRCFRKVTESTDSDAVTTDDMKFHTDPFRSCRVLDQLGTTKDLPNRSGWIRGRDMTNRRDLKEAFLKKYPGYAETMYPHLRSSLWKFDPNNEAFRHVWSMPWPPVEDAEPAEKVVEESESGLIASHPEAGAPEEKGQDVSGAPAEDQQAEQQAEQQESEPKNLGTDRGDAPEPPTAEEQAEPTDSEEIKDAVTEPQVDGEQNKLRSQSAGESPQSLGDKKRKRGASKTSPISPPASPPAPGIVEAEPPSPKRQRCDSKSLDKSPSVQASNPQDAEVNVEPLESPTQSSTAVDPVPEAQPLIEAEADNGGLRSGSITSPPLPAGLEQADLTTVEHTSQDPVSPAALQSVPSSQADAKEDVSTPEPERKLSIATLSVPEEQPHELVGHKRKRIDDGPDTADLREESPVCIKIDKHGYPRLVEVSPVPERNGGAENSVAIAKVAQPEDALPEDALPEDALPDVTQPEVIKADIVQPEVIQPEVVETKETQIEEEKPEEKPKRKRRKRTPLPNAGERVLPWNLRDRKPVVRY